MNHQNEKKNESNEPKYNHQSESNALKSIVRMYQTEANRENLVSELNQMDENQSLK